MFKESLQMQIYSFEEQKQQKKDNDSGPNWRMGKFHDDNDDQ